MSKIGDKMSKFYGETDIVSTDLFYALFCRNRRLGAFQKIHQKNLQHNVQNEGGGGVKGFLNNVQKNCGSGGGGHPLCLKLSITQIAASQKGIKIYFRYIGTKCRLNDCFAVQSPDQNINIRDIIGLRWNHKIQANFLRF